MSDAISRIAGQSMAFMSVLLTDFDRFGRLTKSGVKDVSLSAHEKAPPDSGRAVSSKRVRRFERPTFPLAPFEHQHSIWSSHLGLDVTGREQRASTQRHDARTEVRAS